MGRSGARLLVAGALAAASCNAARTVPTGSLPSDAQDGTAEGSGADALGDVEQLAHGEILIALLTSRTGPLGGIDGGMINAASLARSEINEAGGVLGKKLGILTEDDGSSVAVAREAFHRIVADSRVVATIGPTTQSALEGIALTGTTPRRFSSPMAVISATAAADGDAEPERKPTVFGLRLDPLGKQNAAAYVRRHMYEQEGSFLAVQPDGVDFAAAIYGFWNPAIADERYPAPEPQLVDYGNVDFAAKVESVVARRPDAILLGTYWTDGARITAELSKRFGDGYRPQMVGWPFLMDDRFVAAAARDVVEGMIGFVVRPGDDDPGYGAFAAAYRRAFGSEPPAFAAGIYDAVYLLAFATERAGAAERTAIAAELPTVSRAPGEKISVGRWADGRAALRATGDIDYDGASGAIDWDAEGVSGAASDVWVWTVSNGRIQVIDKAEAW